MRSRKAALALSSLVVLQMLGATGFVTTNVSAQAESLVAVIIGEVSRDACEVTYRDSDDENWGSQSLDGPPVACQGGLVTAYILTQEEANSRVARTATSSESQETTIVPLTGDPSADEEAIAAEMIAIHETLDPGVVPEEDLNQNAARDAGDCRNGHKKQKRRADVRFKSYNVGAVVQAYVHYKRINCARWKITDVRMTLADPPSRDRIWFRDFMYQKVWVPTTQNYRVANAGLQCWRLSEGSFQNFHPGWEIQARSKAFIEAVDSFWLTPGERPSCWLGAGVSFSSGWFYLKGGVK